MTRVPVSGVSSLGAERAGARPASGDLIVARADERAGCFTVGQIPDPPSLVCSSLAAATEAARGFARANRVNVWVSEGGSPELTHAYRPGDRLPSETGPRPRAPR